MRNKLNINNPKTYTLISIIIGYELIGNLSSNAQNALGNFFMTIGQILEENAAIEQAMNGTNNTNINYKEELDLIKDAINKINNSLNNIK